MSNEGNYKMLRKINKKEILNSIAAYTDKIKKNNDEDWFYYQRGLLYNVINELEKAEKDIQTAKKLAPFAGFYGGSYITTNPGILVTEEELKWPSESDKKVSSLLLEANDNVKKGKYESAKLLIEKVIELKPDEAKKNEYVTGIEKLIDIQKRVNLIFEEEQINPETLLQRSKLFYNFSITSTKYFDNKTIDELKISLEDISKAIQQSPNNCNYYYTKAIILMYYFKIRNWYYPPQRNDLEEVLFFLNKALKIDPENIKSLKYRAEINFILENYNEVISDLISLENICDLTEGKYYMIAKSYFQIKNHKNAIKYFTKAINRTENNWLYYNRAVSYFRNNEYQSALNDLKKYESVYINAKKNYKKSAITGPYMIPGEELHNIEDFHIFDIYEYPNFKTLCYVGLNQYKKAYNSFTENVKIIAYNNIIPSVLEVLRKSPLDLYIKMIIHILNIRTKNEENEDFFFIEKSFRFIEQCNYYEAIYVLKSVDVDPFGEDTVYNDIFKDIEKPITDLKNNKPINTVHLKNILFLKLKQNFINYFLNSRDVYGFNRKKTKRQQINHTFLLQLSSYFSKEIEILLEKKQACLNLQNEKNISRTKIQERNKVISDLSHSIKNLISSVIDPLENLKKEMEIKPGIIDSALRGSSLIRETVNAMNLSNKGSFSDFIFDVIDNSGKDSICLRTIVVESLRHSIANMFDGKYFQKFHHKYFPTKDKYIKAKKDWVNVSGSENLNSIASFLRKHFFHINIDLDNAADQKIGNTKGSAIKLMILIQEMIFNAVKYTAFVPEKERFVNINLEMKNKITIQIENSFLTTIKTKTTGLGHIIIENFAKLLKTKPMIKTKNNIYSMSVSFNNFFNQEK